MDPKRTARERVADLLKRFFEGLTKQLASGTSEIWQKVEQRLPQKTASPEGDFQIPPGAMQTTSVRQQPVQQQQSKTQPR